MRLQEAIDKENLNELGRNGLIQRFAFTIDLSWKLLKDYLIHKGFPFKTSPKDTIRQAQESKLIDYGQSLIDGLDIRNDLSHDYSGEKFDKAEQTLREEVYPALAELYNFFEKEVNDNKSE